MKNEEFIDFFLNIKKMSVAELTLQSYKRCLMRYLDLDSNLQDLSPFDAQKIMFAMEGLKNATQRRNLTILTQYYNYAIKYRVTNDNPFAVVEKPKIVHQQITEYSIPEIKLSVIIKIVDSLCLFWQTFFTIAIDTGMRRGELVALRWDDIDTNNNLITVRHSAFCADGHVKIKEPKGRRARDILITNKSVFLLYRMKAKAASDFVFASKTNCDAPINPSSATHYWKRLLMANGLPPYRLHDLRHTCATYLLKYGVDINAVRSRLGHSALSTTQLYIHTTQDLATTNVLNHLLNGGYSC